MQSVHSEVQDFGDKDEVIYKIDKINKENVNKLWIFIADPLYFFFDNLLTEVVLSKLFREKPSS